MPGFDGTGPKGEGPFTGRGEGYCAVKLPDEPGEPAVGYVGREGRPVVAAPGAPPGPAVRPGFTGRRWWPARVWQGPPLWQCRRGGGRRGRWMRGGLR